MATRSAPRCRWSLRKKRIGNLARPESGLARPAVRVRRIRSRTTRRDRTADVTGAGSLLPQAVESPFTAAAAIPLCAGAVRAGIGLRSNRRRLLPRPYYSRDAWLVFQAPLGR